jgi:hypothetical protein
MVTVCAFDIGIKNLAFCVFDGTIKSWKNVNIIAPEEAPAVETCSKCKVAGKWRLPSGSIVCKRHLGTVEPLPGATDKKFPAVADLKAAAQAAELSTKGKKEDLIAALQTKYATPLIKAKKVNATFTPMTQLHDGILKVITDNWNEFKDCRLFCLENQPVLKNPTMKTVQILLYASIRDAFISKGLAPPEMRLVHAGKKVKVETTGDEGYADRKAGSEARAIAYCTAKAPNWLKTITDAKKRSDLADALCMVLDAQTNSV